jgi:3-keto-disaccharide hydrolase
LTHRFRWHNKKPAELNMNKRRTFAHLLFHSVAVVVIAVTLAARAADCQPGPWQALFDGKTTQGWRGYRQTGFPTKGWVVDHGCLHLLPRSHAGDIITTRKFTDFELEWEWRIAPKGNNGVKYLVTEDRPHAPGYEYQMVDDTTMPNPKHQTAAFYAVFAPQANKPYKPPGHWNHSRIVVCGNHVEHWLNGAKVLTYELGSPEVKAAVALSKFKNAPGFGDKITGYIMLTYHNDETWYRNIRIRELTMVK